MEYEIKILTTKESKEWNEILNKFKINDIYYAPEYVKLFEKHQNEDARLFCYLSKNNTIIYPFFLKPIKFKNDIYYDISSTWYYGGPLIYDPEHLSSIKDFFYEFSKYCSNNCIITEFVRTHPLIRNYEQLGNYAYPEKKWDVVYVDLKKEKDAIKAEFKKECRKAINKAKDHGVYIESSKNKRSIEAFYSLYIDAMRRKNARRFYLFGEEFFKQMFEDLKNNAELFLAIWKDKVVSASILMHKNNFANDFLRGFDPAYQDVRPNNLLVYEKIIWSKENNCEYYLLHGGQNKNDGMLRFKSTFSKSTAPFYTYAKIHNQKIYNLLCDEKKLSKIEDYFPPYRKDENR